MSPILREQHVASPLPSGHVGALESCLRRPPEAPVVASACRARTSLICIWRRLFFWPTLSLLHKQSVKEIDRAEHTVNQAGIVWEILDRLEGPFLLCFLATPATAHQGHLVRVALRLAGPRQFRVWSNRRLWSLPIPGWVYETGREGRHLGYLIRQPLVSYLAIRSACPGPRLYGSPLHRVAYRDALSY